jgi:O-6-methylguanine DNA methyltransferase
VACAGEGLVATTVSSTRARTLDGLRRSVPAGVEHRVAAEAASDFALKTIALLVELEAGHEEHKAFSLAPEYVGEPLAGVLKAAAAVPVGYVTSYGDIAKASDAEARVVGRVMATNPLYPIVPCHRVVGANLSLVGYRGSRDPAALHAKLERLSKEARGFAAEKDVPVPGGPLRVYPVEWAIARAKAKAKAQEPGADRQRTLFEQDP